MTTPTETAPLSRVLDTFFETKTACDLEGTMSYFSPDMASYIDVTLGWEFDSYDALKGVFTQYMPNWAPPARSYATRILSGETSALVHMVDTPELFGGELRILAAIDFGKIVRWVDYWDSSAFGAADAPAAHDLLHTDVVLVDMALRTQVIGRIETVAFLDRVLGQVPYGRSSELRDVVGGGTGGGVEWTAADGLFGITALERDADGLVTRITSVYDSRQLEADRKAALIDASFAPNNPRRNA
jgi:hypothetical protein